MTLAINSFQAKSTHIPINKVEHKQALLDKFEAIDLKELDQVKLMNRKDIKFTFPVDQLPDLLQDMPAHYRCLEVKEQRISKYKTLYLDTGNLALYRQHHNGHLNRVKVRYRIYSDSNLCFLEVKKKNNKGRTIKERIKTETILSSFNVPQLEFLSKELDFDPCLLQPSVWVDYRRITFVDKALSERLTIDLDLKFKKDEKEFYLPNLVIAELKQDRKKASAFLNLIRKYHIRENSISKYCLAIATTQSHVKQNNFKEKLLSLKHFMPHDTITSHR